MKAVLQNFKTGEMAVADVPPPALTAGSVLVRTAASLVSVGTERSVIELAKMNPVQKARARPDLVRKILARASQEGVLATAQSVLNRLSTPLPLGYSAAGVVHAVGAGISDLKPGDRVACAGAGYANHAEVIAVPRNLVARIPEGVSFHDAAFVTLGAIALHGVRQSGLTLGETVVVIGLGLVGQLTVQLCAAQGCRVFGIDTDPEKVALAKSLGMDGGMVSGPDVSGAVAAFTRGRGADAVLITASTPSSEPIAQAADLARDRARIVAVGDVGLDVPRRAYYDKELDIRLSRSYGPGRYDPAYEEKGLDYPIGYVRWTENRNMEAFLDLLAAGRLHMSPLITRRFPIERATEAYETVLGSTDLLVGVVLDYDTDKPQDSTVRIVPAPRDRREGDVRVGVIGAGAFAQGTLLPLLAKLPGVRLTSVATRSGLTARAAADKFAAEQATSDVSALIASQDVDAIVIATRHDTHADLTAEAMAHGKHVFVEKPLAVDEPGLRRVIDARAAAGGEAAPIVLTGFNRRFSPLAERLRGAMAGKPLVMAYRINAGAVPGTSWVQDAESGGGRIVGEVCHFIDMFQFLTGADVVEASAKATSGAGSRAADPDNLVVQLAFTDGSVGSIVYASAGSPDTAKERLEVFGGGVTGVIDNWRRLIVRGPGIRVDERRWLATAKGHAEEMAAFIRGVRDGLSPIRFDSQLNTMRATFAVQDSLREGRPVAPSPTES